MHHNLCCMAVVCMRLQVEIEKVRTELLALTDGCFHEETSCGMSWPGASLRWRMSFQRLTRWGSAFACLIQSFPF